MTIGFQCIRCNHYWGEGRCDAFPNGIPEKIISGDYDHSKEHEGDNGIKFELVTRDNIDARQS